MVAVAVAAQRRTRAIVFTLAEFNEKMGARDYILLTNAEQIKMKATSQYYGVSWDKLEQDKKFMEESIFLLW